MPREIDDAWVEEAIDAYRQIEERQAAYRRELAELEVVVRSPDNLIEIVVGIDGSVRQVVVTGSLEGRSNVVVSRAIHDALQAAHEAAAWARDKAYEKHFSGYADLGGVR